ncbi:MAG: lipoyl(octanoyl) transferase LipB [Fimbriimonadaceae bacterium]
MGYHPAWDVQRDVMESVRAGGPDTLLFVEHDPVYTLGAAFQTQNLKWSEEECAAHGIELVVTDRGGDATYHGPGQVVAYPIFNLENRGRDLHRWIRSIEEAVILAIAEFGIKGRRFPPHTGVWVEDAKVCAIGIKVKRWVNLHGLALNVHTDMTHFEGIIPCGIQGYGVTSLHELLDPAPSMEQVKAALVRGFAALSP